MRKILEPKVLNCQELKVQKYSCILERMVLHTESEKQKFAARLRAVLDFRNFSSFHGQQTKLAKCFGVSQRAAGKWLNAESLPKTERIVEIARKLKINSEWLLSGRGSMVDAPGATKEKEMVTENQILIPVYNVEASAGDGILMDHAEYISEYLKIDRAWFNENTGVLPHDKLAIIRITGDSMKGTFDPGDMIVVDLLDSNLTDGIFCIRLGELILVKRLSCQPNGEIDVISDNKKYPPKRWKTNDFAIVGRVLFGWHGERF